jgi:hypothetical protein
MLSIFSKMRGFTTFDRQGLFLLFLAKPPSVPIPIQGVATLARREQHIPNTAPNCQPFRRQTETQLDSELHVWTKYTFSNTSKIGEWLAIS